MRRTLAWLGQSTTARDREPLTVELADLLAHTTTMIGEGSDAEVSDFLRKIDLRAKVGENRESILHWFQRTVEAKLKEEMTPARTPPPKPGSPKKVEAKLPEVHESNPPKKVEAKLPEVRKTVETRSLSERPLQRAIAPPEVFWPSAQGPSCEFDHWHAYAMRTFKYRDLTRRARRRKGTRSSSC